MNFNLVRVVVCGMDVSRMVELGKFDKEFTVYGCAFREEGETKFAISEQAETIYSLHEKLQLQGIFPGKILSYHIATSVPAGSVDEIWENVKWDLGYKLRETFPAQFLDILNVIGNIESKDYAWRYLEKWQEGLEGYYLKDWQLLFDRLVLDCFLRKQLNEKHYMELKAWSKKIWNQMQDDPVIKDIHSRTLHGFAYFKDGRVKYKINAQLVHVLQARFKLVSEGYIVSPIYSEQYWFQTQMQFPAKRHAFEEKLKMMLEPCLRLMKELAQAPAFIEKNDYMAYYERVQAYDSASIYETYNFYGYQWHCL